MTEAIDVKEQMLAERDKDTLELLLMDATTHGNLRWATDDYASFGEGFQRSDEMSVDCITGEYAEVIRPRISKPSAEQRRRTRTRAEVFTPAWVCNAQNNLVDAAWFGRDPGFNIERIQSWQTLTDPILFGGGTSWQDYVSKNVLEVACGEAPYITTRYDVSTGREIPVGERVGMLDRKLRVVTENVSNEDEWIAWAERAVKSCYAYDFQGDNVLLARENVLAAVEDAYGERFGKPLEVETSRRLSEIISWNIWQMDGLTGTAPYYDMPEPQTQLDLGDDVIGDGNRNLKLQLDLVPCLIYDWDEDRAIKFNSLVKGQ